MPIDFEEICQRQIFDMGLCTAAVVARMNGEIMYISNNWSVEPDDIAQCISNWQKRGQFVKLQGIKYSCLMNQPEYFSGINYAEKSFLIGAASPDASDQYFILAYAPPGSSGTNAYVDVVRAANQMREGGGTYMDNSAQMGKYDSSEVAGGGGAAAPAGGSVDPAIKQEVDGFLQWINDPNGLAGYIKHYLDENNTAVLQKLAKAYNDFRNVFGF